MKTNDFFGNKDVHNKLKQSYFNTTKDNLTTFTITGCRHESHKLKKVRINLFLFELEMTFQVCTNCQELLKTKKYWKFIF